MQESLKIVGKSGQNASRKPKQILSSFIMLDDVEGFENTLHDFFINYFAFADALNDQDRQQVTFHYTGLRTLLSDIKGYEKQIKTD